MFKNYFAQDLIDCQGPPADVGGYYKVDEAKATGN